MSTQLIRQEALDGYTDRWMGEVSSLSNGPSVAIAMPGVVLLSSLLGVLMFGSYTPHTTIHGVLGGVNGEVAIVTFVAPTLHIGQPLQLEVQTIGATNDLLQARVIAIVPPPAVGAPQYRVELEIPPASYRKAETHFVVNVPSERRRIYKWILQCLFN